jgi:hypothetical protein
MRGTSAALNSPRPAQGALRSSRPRKRGRNSHTMMMDKSNAEIAGLIQKWPEGKGLIE